MRYAPPRLVLFAILSSIERDLRRHLTTHLDGQAPPSQLLDEATHKKVADRYEGETDESPDEADFSVLVEYLDYDHAWKVINQNKDRFPDIFSRYIRDNTDKFEALVSIRNRVVHSRPLQLGDYTDALEIVRHLIDSKAQYWSELATTLNKLDDDPSFVLDQSLPDGTDDSSVYHNLPNPNFDETGFVGRSDEIDTVKRVCRQPYPVISLLGEGGVGKTALAQKIAYEFVAMDDDSPFDGIVWSSARSSQLTGRELERIEGAIENSLGLFSEIADELAGDAASDPIDEVREYLSEFNLLLILDNLESALDQNLRRFVSDLPHGSTILVTSREGLGQIEYPVPVEELSSDEALQLLRELSRIRRVEELTHTSNERLAEYSQRLNNNPGLIKWFVSNVQSDRRPEELLANRTPALEFFVGNVFEDLDDSAVQLLKVFIVLPGQHTAAELSYLTDTDADDVLSSLRDLTQANMVRMSNEAGQKTYKTSFYLSDLIRDYLEHKQIASAEDMRAIRHRHNTIVGQQEEIAAKARRDPYSRRSVAKPDDHSVIVTKYLRDAIRALEKGETTKTQDLISQARQLAPDFFEVERVAGFCAASMDRPMKAQRAFRAALDLNAQHGPTHYFYAGFVLRNLNDKDKAIRHYRKALELDPEEPKIKRELSRALLWSRQFEQARSHLDELMRRDDLKGRDERLVWDLHLQYYERYADHLAKQDGAYHEALSVLEQYSDEWDECPAQVIDDTMRDKVTEGAAITLDRCKQALSYDTHQERLQAVQEWIDDVEKESIRSSEPSPAGSVLQGKVKTKLGTKGFGFLLGEDGYEDYFFHRTDLADRSWDTLQEGDQVEFVVGYNDEGPCAEEVTKA